MAKPHHLRKKRTGPPVRRKSKRKEVCMDTISTTRIDEIIRECLFNDETEIEDGKPKAGIEMKTGKGVMGGFGFHAERLESNREEVAQMIDLLPDVFRQGMSFLNMCMDKNGAQWGEHRDMDLLICLGTALGLMKVLEGIPRQMLPGGMPYIQVLDQTKEAAEKGG